MESKSVYRKILENKFMDIKTRRDRYSLRAFARDMGLPASVMSQVLNGKRCIPVKSVASVLEKLELSEERRKDFLTSLAKEKASIRKLLTSDDELQIYTLDRTRDRKIIEEWEYAAYLSFMDCGDFTDDLEYCAERLKTNPQRVKEVIADLITSGLIFYDQSMNLSKTHESVDTDNEIPSESLQKSHEQSLLMAQEALKAISMEKRSYTSGTFAVNEDDLPEIKKIVFDFHQRLNKYLVKNKNSKDSVYHIATQLFPISKIG